MIRSFAFVNEFLNRQLLTELKRAKTTRAVVKNGVLHYSSEDEELVENEIIAKIRDGVFASWQILSCPPDWAARYKTYMSEHDIPFAEELMDDRLSFLIPRKYRPHSWKLESQRTE